MHQLSNPGLSSARTDARVVWCGGEPLRVLSGCPPHTHTSFVCPTELGDLADRYDEFKKLGVEIYSVSTDTHFTHKAWHDTSDTIQKIPYPMIADPTLAISRNFDVLIEEEGLALRGTFVINPEGEIKLAEIHDNGIGRDAGELLRKVQAAQYIAAHPGEVCPAKWTPGAETLTPSLDLIGKI